jgi:hypothetical protein
MLSSWANIGFTQGRIALSRAKGIRQDIYEAKKLRVIFFVSCGLFFPFDKSALEVELLYGIQKSKVELFEILLKCVLRLYPSNLKLSNNSDKFYFKTNI